MRNEILKNNKLIINFLGFNVMIPDPVTPPTKKARVLHALCCGKKITRFDAERLLHDHALNSTISQLKNDSGVDILRPMVTVPNFLGGFTRCCEYAINPQLDNLKRCKKLLLDWGYKLPAPPSKTITPTPIKQAA
jgi:hypothetical protein